MAAQRMGYRSNPMAAALAHLKKNSKEAPVRAAIAWLNAWKDPQRLRQLKEFDLYWTGATACAEKFGFHLEEFICESKMSWTRLEKVLYARGINAILLPPHQVEPDWADFCWDRFSIVRFGRSLRKPCCHIVTADQVANMMLAFENVLQRGYKRIGLIAPPRETWWHLFEAGYLRSQQFVPPNQRLPILAPESGASIGLKRLKDWLKAERPDAIITVHPELPGLLKKAGYRVPEDIGLAAMSILDTEVDAGIYQNSEEVGRVAVLLLISLLNDNDYGVPAKFREVLIKGDWVDGSCLPQR